MEGLNCKMKIAFLGDIALIGKYDRMNGNYYKDACIWLKEVLSDCDLRVANLESPLTEVQHSKIPKSMHLRSSMFNVEILNYLGIDVVTLANNHLFDYGMKGARDTIRCLEDSGIRWYGVNGKQLDINVKEEMIHFEGYCCYSTNPARKYIYNGKNNGVNPLTKQIIASQLEMGNHEVARILSIHWGKENISIPNMEHIQFVQNFFQSNRCATIIHGCHPHVVQGLQRSENLYVSYSQGNCLFDTCISQNGKLVVSPQQYNRISYIWIVNMQKSKIMGELIIGIQDTDKGIIPYDIQGLLNDNSERIKVIALSQQYMKEREEEYTLHQRDRLGKRDMKWLLSKINYNDVAARIQRAKNHMEYIKIMEK